MTTLAIDLEYSASAEPLLEMRWDKDRCLSSSQALTMMGSILAAMAQKGYCKRDLFGVQLALEEAIVNAIKHGNRSDPAKTVRIAYRIDEEAALVEIEDEGAGFDIRSVPDPLAPENLERPCGRGLLLMRTYMTWVRHLGRGNRVTMCKHRTLEGDRLERNY
jgi:serine/threonine-protein kinase RsbW